MFLTVKQQVKHLSKKDYVSIRKLAHVAKNLANEALYNVRQYYFQEGEYLNYQKNYALLKNSPNYKTLNSNMAQQILKEVDGSFKSFFGLLKLAKKGKYNIKDVQLPHYLPKDGYTTLVIGFVRLNGNKLVLPYSNQFKKEHSKVVITIPPILLDKKIKEIRIIPKANARFFEIQYTYEVQEEQRNLNKKKALAVDLGINNLATCVSSTGESFIIDGRRLKSINQWFNKQNSRLQSIKDKQRFGKRTTKRQNAIACDRNNKVNDYMAKSARYIINYCLEHDIGTLVLGYNETFQRNSNIGKVNNQNFVNIPFGKLHQKLKYLCQLYGITFVKQEESYTSKASFFDKDIMPTYNADDPVDYEFSGSRIKRGLYQTSAGTTLNADVNGALNILRKSNVVSLSGLYDRGEVDTPIRIRIA
ncbi:transposase [Paenibacillus alvei]|uniref:RNA-guided endonuclease InsQ/TnpB family protein n=1 Tax=Paenibacillus alvei TaxID=44250 RepID=UPI000289EFEB|nr:RNA-guided endonuclease TnpB family protein [Paenibacillus alvei]EJW13797.1 transposase IS200/IS605 family [Paenibacillus alvei DSM 29]MCY9540528.1 transposase [Paenibacillus alvei]MCY9708267.1 transposase [Paenibacillus alvei]MCY9732937.1 transposase [Paenibacillus alvei]MCY9755188.1 transposase [Paenibacillus alvei]